MIVYSCGSTAQDGDYVERINYPVPYYEVGDRFSVRVIEPYRLFDDSGKALCIDPMNLILVHRELEEGMDVPACGKLLCRVNATAAKDDLAHVHENIIRGMESQKVRDDMQCVVLLGRERVMQERIRELEDDVVRLTEERDEYEDWASSLDHAHDVLVRRCTAMQTQIRALEGDNAPLRRSNDAFDGAFYECSETPLVGDCVVVSTKSPLRQYLRGPKHCYIVMSIHTSREGHTWISVGAEYDLLYAPSHFRLISREYKSSGYTTTSEWMAAHDAARTKGDIKCAS